MEEPKEDEDRLALLEHELRRSRETIQAQASLIHNASKVIERQQTRLERFEKQVGRIEGALKRLYASGRWRIGNLFRPKDTGYREVDKLLAAVHGWPRLKDASQVLEKTSRFISYEAWLVRQRPTEGPAPTETPNIHVIVTGGRNSSTMASLSSQSLAPWEVTVLSSDELAERNAAWENSEAEWILYLPAGDTLERHALETISREAKGADLIYTDSDLRLSNGSYRSPFLKPEWSPELALDGFYCGPGICWNRAFVESIGGFQRDSFSEYDLLLRAGERGANIRHVPGVLIHWAAKGANPYAFRLNPPGAEAVVREALARRGQEADVERKSEPVERFFVKRKPAHPDKVTIIIPTRNQLLYLKKAVESLTLITRYPDYEIVIVNNQSDEKETLDWIRNSPHRVLEFDQPFNYSAINNFAVSETEGELLLFLNNDTEIIHADWLERMVTELQDPGVGAVGAQLLYANDTVQHAGVILGIGGIGGHAFRFQHAHSTAAWGMLHYTRNVSALTAACLLTRREVFEETGGFDAEHLRVDYNDVDFCLKIREAGHRLVYTPHARLFHHESVSAKDRGDPGERGVIFHRWGKHLANDPFYNPLLTLGKEDYSIDGVAFDR
ncbi:MAG: glycosyltransferase family 2 protein [Verrucomicrobiota bacterium]